MAIKLGELELATSGDVIVGGLAYSVGFAIDAFFFSGGASSTEVAGASAIGALGTKYGIEKLFGINQKEKPSTKEDENSKD